jgi:hypothetical protein
VNEPAVAAFAIALKQTAARANRTKHWNNVPCIVDLLDAFGSTRLASPMELETRPARRPAAQTFLMVSVTVISRDHRADCRIRVRAEVPATRVVHIPGSVGTVLLFRGGQWTRHSGEDDGESNCDLREHGFDLLIGWYAPVLPAEWKWLFFIFW